MYSFLNFCSDKPNGFGGCVSSPVKDPNGNRLGAFQFTSSRLVLQIGMGNMCLDNYPNGFGWCVSSPCVNNRSKDGGNDRV